MSLTLFLLLAITTAAVVRYCGGRLTSPAITYMAVWSVALVVATSPGRGYAPLTGATWRLVLIAAGSFLLGCLTAAVVRRRGDARGGTAASEGDAAPNGAGAPTLYDEARLDRWYKLGLAALVGWTVLDVYRVLPLFEAAGGISGIFGGNGLSFREAALQTAAQAATSSFQSGSLALAIAGYVLFAGNLTLVWGSYYASRGRWLRAMVPLVVIALYSVLTVERFQFVYSLLIFLFAYGYHRRLGCRAAAPRRRRSAAPMIALIAVVIAVVFVPLALRGQANSGSQRVNSMLDYVGGGVAGLNVTLFEHQSKPPPSPGFGVWTLYGLATIGERLGVPVKLPPTLLPYASIAARRQVENNVETYIIYPYYDLGVLGVVIVAFALGAAATGLERAVRTPRGLGLVFAAGIASTTVVMSFFGLSLVRDFRWLYLIALAMAITPRLRTGASHPPRPRQMQVARAGGVAGGRPVNA